MAKKNSEDKGRGLVTIPASPAFTFLCEVLETHGTINKLSTLTIRKMNHGYECDYDPEGMKKMGNLRIWESNENGEVILELEDINMIAGDNDGVKKVLFFLLMKLNMILTNGKLPKGMAIPKVTFSLDELVEYGIYKSLKSAKMHINSILDLIKSTSLTCKSKVNHKWKTDEGALISHYCFIENTYTVIFDSEYDYTIIASKYMKLPEFYFRLSNRGAETLYYLCSLLRQNEAKIKEQGYINISMESFQRHHCLRDVGETQNSKRDTVNPIDGSLDEITKVQEILGLSFIRFEKEYELKDKAYKIMATGFVRVYPEGILYDYCVDRAKAREKKAEEMKKYRKKKAAKKA